MPPVDRNLVAAALLEQHRWEFNCEAMYRKGLASEPIDEACLSDMLRSFGIARNLSLAGKKALQDQLPEIANQHRKQPHDWEAIFAMTGNRTCGLYIEGSAANGGAPRSFVSGLTKVLWFADSHKMPMFDSLTCASVGAQGKTQSEKAISFYKLLRDKWGYDEVFERLSKLKKDSPPSWGFFPERLIDKLLLFKGLKPNAMENRVLLGSENRRKVYLDLVGPSLAKELHGLLEEICDTLESTRFNQRLSVLARN